MRNETIINSTLDFFLSSTEIKEIKAIDTELSDHKPIVTKIRISSKIKVIKKYIHHNSYKIDEEGISKLLNSNWPEVSDSSTKNLFKNKIVIRPVIKMQSKANTIFREKIGWKDKAVKLNDLRKTEFKEFMKTLDLNCKEDKK